MRVVSAIRTSDATVAVAISFRCLTFDMRRGRRQAKLAGGRRLDGAVRYHGSNLSQDEIGAFADRAFGNLDQANTAAHVPAAQGLMNTQCVGEGLVALRVLDENALPGRQNEGGLVIEELCQPGL